jgi:hypothetical protein
MPIHLPTKAIRTAVEASLASLGADGLSPSEIPEHDIRRASKAAKRVIELLEELAEAVEKFERDFATAEAKTPRKQLANAIANVLPRDPKDPNEVVDKVSKLIHEKLSKLNCGSQPANSAKKSISKTALDQRDAAGRIPETEGTTGTQRDGGRAAAASAARSPRRRQKPIDPIVAELKAHHD